MRYINFNSKKFQEELKRYEDARQNGEQTFMQSEKLATIAEYYFSKGDAENARETAEFATSLYPGSIEPLAFLSRMSALVENDIKKAYEYADKIADHDDLDYSFLMAELDICQNNCEKADKYLEDLYNSTDDLVIKEEISLDSAEIFADYECWQEARKWIGRNTTDHKEEDYLYIKARLDFTDQQYAEAEKTLNTLLDKDPYNNEYWNLMAKSQLAQEKYEDAGNSIDYAAAIDPDNMETLFLRANNFFGVENYVESERLLKEFIKKDDQNAAVLTLLGLSCIRLGKYEEAEKVTLKALEMEGATKEFTLMMMAQICNIEKQMEKFDLALDYANKALDFIQEEKMGQDAKVEYMTIRGQVLIKKGPKEEAFAYIFKEFDEMKTLNEKVGYAIYYFHEESYNIALTLFERLREQIGDEQFMSKNFPNVYATMAVCAMKLNNNHKFEKYVALSQRKDPDASSNLFK